MNAADMLTKARALLVQDSPFWASLALRLKYEPAPAGKLPDGSCAGVDGVHFWYVPDLIEGLTMPQLKGLIAHEVSHLAQSHHVRRGGRDPEQWNLAADYVVNPLMVAAGFEPLPGEPECPPELLGLSTEETYSRMTKPDPDGDDSAPCGGGDSGPDGAGGGGDAPGDSPGSGQPDPQGAPGDGQGDGAGDAPAPVQSVVLDYPGPEGDGEPSPADLEDQAREWRNHVAQAMANGQAAGMFPGAAEELARAALRPRVPWQSILWPFLQRAADDYSWTPPDRRMMGVGLFLPALESEGLRELVLAVDTSGSMPGVLVSEMLTELAAVLDLWPAASLRVLFHHSDVYRVETFTADNPPEMISDREGGGTDFRPVFDRIDLEGWDPDCVVMLTDLRGPAPALPPPFPVLWVSYGLDRAPWGEIVQVGR